LLCKHIASIYLQASQIYLDMLASKHYIKRIMNRLSVAKRVQVVSALVEGVSINATCRMTGVAKHTVLNLLRDLGNLCTSQQPASFLNKL
jgi:hypothetical protein